jgi:hypothetical protein
MHALSVDRARRTPVTTIGDEPGSDQDDELGVEVPEADAIEQRLPVVPDDVDDEPDAIPEDAPEADALEQAKSVPPEDDAQR